METPNSGGATVPQVASDPKIYAHSPTTPRQARPAQQSDREASPFESLLDDGASPTPPPSAATAPEDKTEAADESRASSKSTDCKAPPANDGTKTKKTDEVQGGTNEEDNAPTDGIKKTLGAVLAEGLPGADEGKPVVDKKTTVATHPADPTTDQSADSSQTVTTANACAGAVAALASPLGSPSDQVGPKEAQDEISLALDAKSQLSALASGPPKIATGKQTDPVNQSDTEQPAQPEQAASEMVNDSQATLKNVAQSHTGKSQIVAGDNDKSPTQARNEGPTDGQSNRDAGMSSNDAATASPKMTMDTGTQSPAITPAGHANGPTALASPSAASQPTAIPLAGLAIEIAGKALAGKNRFEIRLDPPELGRIEVRLDVDHDGNVTSRLTVDRADTYDLLRRDAAGLERALQDAGLKTADNGLQFSLRDQSANQQQANSGDTAQLVVQDDTLPTEVTPQIYNRLAGQGGGLDIRV
jgi:flagellar hook-length control protein FliK